MSNVAMCLFVCILMQIDIICHRHYQSPINLYAIFGISAPKNIIDGMLTKTIQTNEINENEWLANNKDFGKC